MKILIIDDIKENLYLLETLLKGSGYEVLTAKDGVEALEKLKKGSIDMIVSDILMPKMDGFQLCRECKKDDSVKKIPFMFYTATYTDKKDEEFALSLGAEKFIVKPQEPEAFLKILSEVIEEHKKEAPITPKKPIKEEEIYFEKYNKRLIQKLEKKMLDLEKSEKRIKDLNNLLVAIRGVNQLIIREKNRDVLLQKACDILTEVRGYNTAWLGLLKDEKSFVTVVGSPFKEISSLCKQLLRDFHTPCIKKAFTKKDLFLFMNRSRDCGDCIFKKIHLDNNTLIIRITHKSKLFGFLFLSLEPDIYVDEEEESLLKEVTSDIAFGLHSIELGENLGKRTYDLNERVKELNCLYEISDLVEKPDISLEAIIEGTVNLIPPAWQYPEITCAKIIFGGKEYKTKNFKETIYKQSTDIMVAEKPAGNIVVCYLEERPEIDKGPFLKEEINLIKIIAERLGRIIERKQGEVKLQQSYQKLKRAMNATIETISKIVEAKDPYTAGHQQRVSQLATAIAKELNLSQDKIEGIRIASLIHDIGKIGLPTEILSKPNKLSDIEFNLIKEHSQIGYNILKFIDFSYPVAQIVLQHHERLNGSGYPNHLKGDKIFLEACVIGVADVVEAMSSHRPYRPALGIDKALEEISQNRGILYDPKVVDACSKSFKEKGFKFE